MAKRRKLADLYKRGVEASLDDGSGDPVNVWVQKLNPIEQEKALRKANAHRARLVAAVNKPDGEVYESYLSEAQDLDREQMLDHLTNEALANKRAAVEAEVEAGDEWKKDDYLTGLRDTWDDGLRDKYAEDPEDDEAKHVFAEMQRFIAEVDKRLLAERDFIRDTMTASDDDTLRRRVIESLIRSRADLQWMGEYRRCQVWLSVRDPADHKQHYFESVDEVYELEHETLMQLIEIYSDLEVEAIEGKGSRVTPDSSSSSEPSSPVEMEQPSSQAA